MHPDEIKSQPLEDPWSMPNGVDRNAKALRSAPSSTTNGNARPKLTLNGAPTARSRSMENKTQVDSARTSLDDTVKQPVLLSNGTESYQWFLDLDLVKVTTAPEKEGFIFKHVNYVVESQQRNSKVLRRYSDFYWLWETLLKRYPMRVIPNLPPKKLGGSKPQNLVSISCLKIGSLMLHIHIHTF